MLKKPYSVARSVINVQRDLILYAVCMAAKNWRFVVFPQPLMDIYLLVTSITEDIRTLRL